MKHTLLSILLFFFLVTNAMSQNIVPSNDLVGKWKVIDIQVLSKGLSKEQVIATKTLRMTFLKARFEFKADKHFSFETPDLEWNIKNAHWKYNPKTNSVAVQEWKDRNVARPILMEIFVKQADGKILFLLDETPFILQVERVD